MKFRRGVVQLLHGRKVQDGSIISVPLVPELNWVTGAPKAD